MSLFDRIDRLTSRAVDRTFADSFTFIPCERSPNGRPVADPARQPVAFKGVFDEVPTDGPTDGETGRIKLYSTIQSVRLELSVDVVRYPDLKAARQGDRIEAPNGRTYDIVSVRDDDSARLALVLVRA